MRALSALLVLSTLAFAQTFTARITGVIRDSSEASVPGAQITARQVDTNVLRRSESDPSGVYVIPLLMPGVYEVTVAAGGFQPQVRRDVRLEVNQTATLDFVLRVSEVSTVVDVTADVPLLQSETGSFGTTLERTIVEDFPLVEHDVMGLLRSIPGVIASGQVANARASRNVFDSTFSVGGSRMSFNEVLLDGAANTIGDFNGVVVIPPQDAVQEFRVETSSFSAEFGRTGGGVVNIVTKAGTNQYHGSLFYFHQNDAFNANSFTNNRYATPRSILRRHNYGFTAGGPIRIPKRFNGKNHTFFFSAFQGRREKDPVQTLTSIPTEAELSGDFSNTVVFSGNLVERVHIFDPATTRMAGNAPTRDPFPGDVIPAGRINPIARRVLAEYPQPNRRGSSITGRFNYLFNGRRSYSRDLISNRVDHYFNDRHRLFGRASLQENLEQQPSDVVKFTSVNDTHDHFKNIALDDTFQFTPRLINIFRYSYARFRANLTSKSIGFDPTTLGLPGYIRDSANILLYPNFSFGFVDIGGGAYNNQPRDTQGFQNNIVYTQGRHNLKTGAEYRLYRFYPFQVFNPTGGFTFSAAYTQRNQLAAASPVEGFGLASFLLGTGTFAFEHVEPLSAYHHYVGAYFHDDWKITGRLTLNLGLRWETETGTGESGNRLTYFDPAAPAAVPGLPNGALLFTGGRRPRTLRDANNLGFSPRAGFAWRLQPRTVIRAGFGMFFLPLGLEPTIVTTPFNYSVYADVLNLDYTPKTTLSDPFPGGILRPASAGAVTDGSYRLGTFANLVLRNEPNPYLAQWNLAFSRQLARTTVFDMICWGSRGVHLPIPSLELNQVDSKNLENGGAYMTELVANPYYGKFTSGLLARPMIPRMQLLKPYPQFAGAATANAFGGSLNYYRPPVGDSIYHAVTFKFERRFTKGLSINAHYTISKLIDTGGGGNGAAYLDPSGLRDIYNIRLERSVGSFDVPQRLVVTYSLELPFGRNKRLFRHAGRKLDRLIGGWTMFGFHTGQAGRPVAVGGPDLSRLAGANPTRASAVPGETAKLPYSVSIANARDYNPECPCTGLWLNPRAFTTTPEFVIPNGPRFLPDVREGRSWNWDLTLYKKVPLREGIVATFEVKAYNVLNQVVFGGPSITTVVSRNFGAAGGQANSPRRLDLGVKIRF